MIYLPILALVALLLGGCAGHWPPPEAWYRAADGIGGTTEKARGRSDNYFDLDNVRDRHRERELDRHIREQRHDRIWR